MVAIHFIPEQINSAGELETAWFAYIKNTILFLSIPPV